jgi:serine-type D-Ala-D-Ala carboxypeptidase (penicillin-binding protein 5/6)
VPRAEPALPFRYLHLLQRSDLLTLRLAAVKNPVFRSLVALGFYHLPKGSGHHEYWWDGSDSIIMSYPGAVGMETGYTDDAGHCLLFEAVRNGRTLSGVVLGSPAIGPSAVVQDAEQMLNWGFRLFWRRVRGAV